MYPNQRTVIISDNYVNMTGGRQYLVAYVSDIEKAAKELNGTAFKVYMYFCGLSSGFQCEYSPKHIQKAYGVSEDSARDAIKELREHGFLTQHTDNTYIFHRNPHEEIDVVIERRWFTGKSGKKKALTKKQVYNYLRKKCTSQEITQLWNNAEVVA